MKIVIISTFCLALIGCHHCDHQQTIDRLKADSTYLSERLQINYEAAQRYSIICDKFQSSRAAVQRDSVLMEIITR